MLKRFLKQLFTSLFTSQTAETLKKEKEIDRQVAKLKQMQRTIRQNPPIKNKQTV